MLYLFYHSVDFWRAEGKLVISAPNAHPTVSAQITNIFKILYHKLGVSPLDPTFMPEELDVETEIVSFQLLRRAIRMDNGLSGWQGNVLFICEEGQTEAEFL